MTFRADCVRCGGRVVPENGTLTESCECEEPDFGLETEEADR